jgi:ribose 5-phosphate isomerase B
VEEATSIVDTFLATEFSDEARHRRRVGMVSAYESDRTLPAPPDTTD